MFASPLVALALVVPAQPPAKQPPAKQPADVSFGLEASSEYHWPLYVLTSPDVQKELKLTREQLRAFAALQPELKKRVEAGFTLPTNRIIAHNKEVGRWADRAVAERLTADQYPRYRQIVWQVLEFNGGPLGMASNPVFSKEIGFTPEQIKKAEQIAAEYYKAWKKLALAGPLGNAPVPGADKLSEDANEKALKLLTAEHKKKWNAALGEPFEGDITPLPVPGMPPKPFKAPAQKK
jgi:hypothetical protein